MELDITSVLIAVMIGIGLGVGAICLYVWIVIRRFRAEIDQLVQETVQVAKDSLVGVVLEEDAGQLYCYRESDRQFLCQGANISDIKKMFGELYPDKTAYLADGDPALIERIKAELAELKKKETGENSISV
jgi:hypothetical protein